MKLSLKARKELYAPNMTQQEIADAISDDTYKVARCELNLVMNGKASNSPKFNMIRNRLEKFLIEKEKEVT
jgi:hypothetical protein